MGLSTERVEKQREFTKAGIVMYSRVVLQKIRSEKGEGGCVSLCCVLLLFLLKGWSVVTANKANTDN